MLVPVKLVGTGCETAARELQGRLGNFSKSGVFSQRLVRAYVSFEKGPQQIHSILYPFGHCDCRKVARLFQRHLRFVDIAPKILNSQIWDLEAVEVSSPAMARLSSIIAVLKPFSSVFGTHPSWLAEEFGKGDSAVKVIAIDPDDVSTIRVELRESGSTESVIYPDLDGLGREMNQIWEDRK